MTCFVCKHGETHPGQSNLVIQRGATIVVIKEVPADICIGILNVYQGVSVHASRDASSRYTARRHARRNDHHLRELTFLEESYSPGCATDQGCAAGQRQLASAVYATVLERF